MSPRLRKQLLLTTLAGSLALFAFNTVREQGTDFSGGRATPDPGAAGASGAAPRQAGADSAQGLLALPERPAFAELRSELFSSRSWQPPVSTTVAVAPPRPVVPPLPYKYAGKLVRDGEHSVLLAKGDTVFPIKVGETLDGAYRVEAVSETQVTLVYLPLKHKEIVPIDSSLSLAGDAAPTPPPVAQAQAAAQAARETKAAAPVVPRVPTVPAPIPTSAVLSSGASSKPAQLLWEGPQQVRLGTRFDVSLKITSGEPVHATPMQLRFDPSYLEFVAAKPGKLFGGANPSFSYRANADGSIFVGVSSPRSVAAADSELLVLTFRPVRPAPVAELSVASLNLQGAAGKPIAVSQLDAFRTAISP